MPLTARMSHLEHTDRAVPRFPAAMLLPAALMAVVLLWLAWALRQSRTEIAALRTELTEVRLAHRVAASHESLAAEAARRAARLEETLALMRQSADSSPPSVSDPHRNRAAELERVITFLRGEITAAHETIERLKESGEGQSKAEKAESPTRENKSQPGL